MTIYFAACEIPGFEPSSSNVVETASASSFERADTCVYGPSAYAIIPDLPDLDTFYCHGFIDRNLADSTLRPVIVFVDNAGVERLQLRWRSTGYDVQYKAAGSFATIGSEFTVGGDSEQEVDIYLDAQASGTCTVWIAGTQRFTYSGDLSSADNIAEIRLYGYVDTAREAEFRGFVVADAPTIGWRTATYYPAGAGNDTAWTGAYTAIDELIHSDVDAITSSAADQVETVTTTGPSLSGYTVLGVVVAVRARRGASGPQNLQVALRSAGTNYFSSTKSLTVGFETKMNIWETNPATSVAFTTAEIASLQPGVKSIT